MSPPLDAVSVTVPALVTPATASSRQHRHKRFLPPHFLRRLAVNNTPLQMLYKPDSPPPQTYASPPPAFSALPLDYTGSSYKGATSIPTAPTGSSAYSWSDNKTQLPYPAQPFQPPLPSLAPNRRPTNAVDENQAVQPQLLGYSAPVQPRSVRSQDFHTTAKPPGPDHPLQPVRPLSMLAESAAGGYTTGSQPHGVNGSQYEQRSFAAAGSAIYGKAPSPAYSPLAYAQSRQNLNPHLPGQLSSMQQFAQQPTTAVQNYVNHPSMPPKAYHSSVITSQPQGGSKMVVAPGGDKGNAGGNRNAKNLPMGVYGRDWSYPLYDCCGDCGTCLLATCCPCIIYTKNKQRLDYLAQRGIPDPVQGDDCCNMDCMSHGCLTLCGLGCVLQMPLRKSIRMRYTIEGGGCQDFCVAWCCTPCQLTQESRELQLEERSFISTRK